MHEYRRRLELAIERVDLATKLKQEKAFMIKVMHDDDCPVLAGAGECNCDPDLIVTNENGEAIFTIDKNGDVLLTQ